MVKRPNRGAKALGVLFGLNVPACAAPLLAALFAASFGAGSVLQGFWVMAVFGLALSLPLIIAVASTRLRAFLQRLATFARQAPIWIGATLILLGVWTIYLAVRT
jgi:cytochrome c-type biogenesis protein